MRSDVVLFSSRGACKGLGFSYVFMKTAFFSIAFDKAVGRGWVFFPVGRGVWLLPGDCVVSVVDERRQWVSLGIWCVSVPIFEVIDTLCE